MFSDSQHLRIFPDDATAPPPRSSRAVHWLALFTAVATIPLISMGGLVTSYHAGMSVPDWPNSFGYNMFLFPPSQWVGGILYEHTHRLMATVVGMLATALAVWAWRGQIWNGVARLVPSIARWKHAMEPHRYLALAVLGGVIFQGVLGGLRVVLVKLDLAIAHACVAQAFFCLAAYMALVTSKGWSRAGSCTSNVGRALPATKPPGGQCPPYTEKLSSVGSAPRTANLTDGAMVRGAEPTVSVGRALPAIKSPGGQCPPYTEQLSFVGSAPRTANLTNGAMVRGADPTEVVLDPAAYARGRNLFKLGAVTVAVVYCQLIVGATMRHFDAGLAIPDLPLAYGKWLPPTSADGLAAVNHLRAFQLNLDPVALSQVWLHFGHRIGAVLVSGLVIAFAVQSLRRREARGLAAPAVILLLLLVTQVTLGVLTVLLRKPADVASAHVAVGALVLVISFVMTARAGRTRGSMSRKIRPSTVQETMSEDCADRSKTSDSPSPCTQGRGLG